MQGSGGIFSNLCSSGQTDLHEATAGLVVGVLAVITFARSRIFPTLTTLWPVVPWGALLGMLIGMPVLCALVAIVLTPRHQKRLRRIN